MNIYLIAKQEVAKRVINDLKQHGNVVVLEEFENGSSEQKEVIKDKSEKVIGIDPGITEWNFPDEVIKTSPDLKGICTKSAWAHYINLELAEQKNIVVCNTPGTNSQSVAEYAVWQMLSLAKKLPIQLADNLVVKLDNKHMTTEIEGKTMGVIGLGNIGTRIGKMGKGLGMKVIYWSKSKKDVPYQKKPLEDVLKKSDFIFNCLETCDETKDFLNKEKLSLMGKNSYFISVLGGMGWGVQDDKHLVQMVSEGKLAGFSVEGEHEKKFKAPSIKGNVFVPSAYAWYTNEAVERGLKAWTDSIIGVVIKKPVNTVTLPH